VLILQYSIFTGKIGIPLSRLQFLKPDKKTGTSKAKRPRRNQRQIGKFRFNLQKKEKMVVHRDQPN